MAVYHPHTVTCTCGNVLVVQLADSINVKRSPEARDKILRGELHRVACTRCNRELTVEKPFYYTDLTRNAFFKVLPRGERHLWKDAPRDLDTSVRMVPATVSSVDQSTRRVVFGMDELREKLIAQDASIDDRVLELLKVLLVYEHPVLLRRSRLRLVLESVTDHALKFAASYEHHLQRFALELPRTISNDLLAKENLLREWVKRAHPQGNIFETSDHWVNMWRWSPQPGALDSLRQNAELARQGKKIDTSSTQFKHMLQGLPRGNHLPAWAKQDLRALFDYAKKRNLPKIQDSLFEIRFDLELEDDWAQNDDPQDIDTLWKLLRDLPDSNVEGNTKIREILLEEGGGGWYSPRTYDIAIGSNELKNRERFEDVMRHEVGHAVHEMRSDAVNAWLTTRFGWRVFGQSDADIDAWVQLMGGWGTLNPAERADVRQYLRTALGNGSSWNPGPTPTPPSGHPWYRPDFGPRLAFEKTEAHWFQTYQNWHRSNGKAFFLNFWYRTFMVVDETSLELVAKMPDEYASMSHYEFFAELYALYYDMDDPLRSNVPQDVAQWLEQNIGSPEVNAPHPAQPAPKRAWEEITRPGSKRAKKR